MDFLNEGLTLVRSYWHILALMALTLAVVFWWEQVRYFFMRLSVWFPLIGTIARESRRSHKKKMHGDKVLHDSEKALCSRFYAHYETFNRDAAFYDKCADYLRKADELGRRPKSLPMWIGTIILVLLEAYIFSLVLVPFMDNRVSSNQAIFAAWGLAIMIAVILVTVTHMMGWEIHRNGLLKKARALYERDVRENDGKRKGLQSSSDVDLDNTYKDNEEPFYIQIVNRVPHDVDVKGSWWITAIAVTLITVFAVGAYWIRSLTINELETGQVNNSLFAEQSSFNGGASMSIFDLPKEAQNAGKAADERAAREILSDRIQAYKTTFVILSVIFVGIQIVGILVGYFYSFAGRQSKQAAKFIGPFNSAEEFADYYEMKRERIAADAQAALDELHRRIENRYELAGNDGVKAEAFSFMDYVREREIEKEKNREQERRREEEREREQEKKNMRNRLVEGKVDLTTLSEEELLDLGRDFNIDAAVLRSLQKEQAARARASGDNAGGTV